VEALSSSLSSASSVELDAPLRARTTLGVGGPARALVVVATPADLVGLLGVCRSHGVPRLVLGRGSNLLVSDEGWDGVVVQLGPGFVGVEVEGDAPAAVRAAHPGARVVRVGAGSWNAHVVKELHREGLVGPEFLALIPGAFGGAVAMNAGTRWGELSSVLVSATCVSPDGTTSERDVASLQMSYRRCGLGSGELVVAGRVVAWAGDVEAARERIKAEKTYRSSTQPYQDKSAGSFFANPPGDAAGRLIEAAGLKGLRWGGAQVSARHANFIVNTGEATASEVIALMALARRLVAWRWAVSLRPEVKLVGFGPGDAGGILDRLTLPPELLAAARAHGASVPVEGVQGR